MNSINYKNLLIIFLVALLGGFIGNYGGAKLSQPSNPVASENGQQTTTLVTKTESDLKSAIEKAYPTVVRIKSSATQIDFFNRESTSAALGSGVILSEDGYIVTNNHVIDGAQEVTVYIGDDLELPATLIGTDQKTDIALIKVEAHDLPYAKIADSDHIEIGDDAIAIGNPLGSGISVTNGIVSAIHKEITINRETMSLIQTNAEINSGNSGGGLFNINGELIGIVNAKTSSSMSINSASVEGLGYAIPSNTMVNVVKSLKEFGYYKNRASLGVTISELSQSSNGFEAGIYITSIQANSAAEKANLQVYDRIIKINGEETPTYTRLSYYLNQFEVGDEITLTVIRNNKEMDVKVTLQEAVNPMAANQETNGN